MLTLEGLRFPTDAAVEQLKNFSAVQLFVQRARQVQTSFSLDDNAEAVEFICQQVEGMPLGLELAASWLRAMTCEQIAARMGESVNFLTTPLRNIPERHRSLRTVFEQSWKLLSADEQAALMRLSVFRGGFDAESAEQVAEATLLLLASLTDKSLIRLNAAGRYDLHELLRQYAAEKLEEAGEALATANRHLDYFLKLAKQAETHQYGSEQPAWMDRVEEEVDNVRAALSWSLEGGSVEQGLILTTALCSFWEYRGHIRDGDGWTERLLNAAQGASPPIRAKALVCAGELLGNFIIHEQPTLLFTEALVIARQIDDQAAIARALPV